MGIGDAVFVEAQFVEAEAGECLVMEKLYGVVEGEEEGALF